MAISRFSRQISFIFAVGALRGVPARRGSERLALDPSTSLRMTQGKAGARGRLPPSK